MSKRAQKKLSRSWNHGNNERLNMIMSDKQKKIRSERMKMFRKRLAKSLSHSSAKIDKINNNKKPYY